jgi:hypothetical protein
MSTDVHYHLQRARTERNVAYCSADGVAADVHMRLSALHLAQALLLQAVQRGPVRNMLPLPLKPKHLSAPTATLPRRAVELPCVR